LIEKVDQSMIQSGFNQPDFIIKKKKQSASTGQAFYKKTKGYTSGGTSSAAKPSFFGNQIIKKHTLYNGVHELGNGNYMIEMLIS